MYWLYSIDAVVRIVLAIAFLFVGVPLLARQRSRDATLLARFFWNFGVGITIITVAGQLLTLGNLFSPITLFAGICLFILWGRARYQHMTPWALAKRSAENAFLAFLNIFDQRVNVRRRVRRAYRRSVSRLRDALEPRVVRLQVAGWTALVAIAGGLRLFRPLSSANLGLSDTYGHLYLLKLLAEGRQVDPQFGPYPRGMHFLLMAVNQLTNVDEILLMNFFGPVVGVLITLAVADTARRLSGSVVAGLLAGLLFATYVGGPSQYFILGGAFQTDVPVRAADLAAMSYEDLARTAGEFDVAITDFHRQTSTLSQELAISLLFPAAMFLFDFLKRRERWHLLGFAGCTAAIAAVHSGVLIPLILMSALAVVATVLTGQFARGAFRPAVSTGFVAVLIGSAWSLAFIAYPLAGGKSHLSGATSVASAVLYYFPFLRPFADGETSAVPVSNVRVYVTLTPFLAIFLFVAALVIVGSLVRRDEGSAGRTWIALSFLLFVFVHFSSVLDLPQMLETTRNSQWMVMSLAALVGVAVVELASLVRYAPRLNYATATGVIAVLIMLLWVPRVPALTSPIIRDRIVNYSGYGGTAYAVLRIERSFEPYTWTLVSYGQEFPMVLRRGFHLSASDFLERFDPSSDILPVPTRHVFFVVEKTPHRFQIDNWSARFNRTEIEDRLQTWIHIYQASHSNLRVFLEDKDVRVYQIIRTPEELQRLARQASL